MPQTWTQEQIAEWNGKRDKQRIDQGLCLFSDLTDAQKKATLVTQRSELLKTTLHTMISTAWAVERYPLSIYTAPSSGVLELPRNYLSTSGSDSVCTDRVIHILI